MSKGFSRLGAILAVLAIPAAILLVSSLNPVVHDGNASKLARMPFVPAAAIAASPAPGPNVIGNLTSGGVINGCGGIINNCAAGICGTMAACLSNYKSVYFQALNGAIASPGAQSTSATLQCWPTAGYATVTIVGTATATATAEGVFCLFGTSTNQGTTPTIAWHGEN